MDLYVVLGITQSATDADIRRAYRRLARRYHPDVNPGDQAAAVRFEQILEAYETLIDPDRRHRYDVGQPEPQPLEARASGFEGFDFSARGSDHSATFGDLMAEMLSERHARRARHAARGADLHQEVSLTFLEALRGVEKALLVVRRETCRACAGTARAEPTSVACAVCGGAGAVRSVRGHMVFARPCPSCEGGGRQRPGPCTTCAGMGQETRSEPVTIRLAAGIGDGERVRVPGKGHAGSRGADPGDLYITVRVADDARFRREGLDLHTIVPIAIHEAALGARIEIDTPDGPVRVRVPPGMQSGQRVRLRERGVPSVRGDARGDLIIEVRLMLPAVLDERSKELLREFGAINGGTVRTSGSS